MPRKKQQTAIGKPSTWPATEKYLNSMAMEYENEYFEDMTFQARSIAGDVFLEYEQHIFSNKKHKYYYDILSGGLDFSIKQFPFKVKKLKGLDGEIKLGQKIIFINSEFIGDKALLRATVLHEMVHAYDWTLDQCFPLPLRDILIIRLYGKLKDKIENLDKHLMAFSHIENQRRILDSKAGERGILFYLKCLDLEIRLNLPFGKISGFYPKKKMRLKREEDIK